MRCQPMAATVAIQEAERLPSRQARIDLLDGAAQVSNPLPVNTVGTTALGAAPARGPGSAGRLRPGAAAPGPGGWIWSASVMPTALAGQAACSPWLPR